MTKNIMKNSSQKNIFYLKGLNCPVCAKKIEDKINSQAYIKSSTFNFSNQKLEIESFIKNNFDLKEEIQNICDSIEDGVRVVENITDDDEKRDIKKTILIFLLELVTLLGIHFLVSSQIKVFLYLALYLFVAKDVLKEVFTLDKKISSFFDENFLVAIASIAAFFTGAYTEAISVMLFYNFGEFLQDMAVESSRSNISAALQLKPAYANLKTTHGTKKVNPEEVKIGQVIVIKPGEKIPLDGIVVSGSSQLDTSNITGESVPVNVEVDDEILSGVLNINGLLEIKVTKEYAKGTIGKILDMVENASSKKAGVEKFITRFAKYYTPIVVFIALFLALLLPIITDYTIKEAIYRSCIFLVISCPCALVISVPLGIFAGIGSLSRKAIFVKGGNFVESLTDVKTVVFDKTGTITQAKFEVFQVLAIEESKEDVIKFAAIGEQYSTHPIAKAIAGMEENLPKPENLKNIDGKGICYTYNGKEFLVGNLKLLKEFEITLEEKFDLPLAVHVYVIRDKKLLGIISLRDKVKDGVEKDIKDLKNLGIKPIILSGDKKEIVRDVAKSVGIDTFYGDLLPLDKVSKLENIMENSQGKVAFIGDGTNDAPVLTRADVGISMGSGSDIAIESSDVVLLKDQISKVVETIKISLMTKRIVYENIGLALILKIIILILGALGVATMFLAIFADVGVSLLCIFNSLRLMKA